MVEKVDRESELLMQGFERGVEELMDCETEMGRSERHEELEE